MRTDSVTQEQATRHCRMKAQMTRYEFLLRAGQWVAALLTVFVVYSATHFWGQANPVSRFLGMLVENLPGFVALVLPPAVFASAMHDFGLIGRDGTGSARRNWALLFGLSLAAYGFGALVEPMLAGWTGSDWGFPASMFHAARAEQAAAETASGAEAARHLRRAGIVLVQIYVPIANAAFAIVAAVLGESTGRLTRAMSSWSRYAARWLAGGLLMIAFWLPAILASELVSYNGAWEGLLLLFPLCLPLVLAGILTVVARPQ